RRLSRAGLRHRPGRRRAHRQPARGRTRADHLYVVREVWLHPPHIRADRATGLDAQELDPEARAVSIWRTVYQELAVAAIVQSALYGSRSAQRTVLSRSTHGHYRAHYLG